LIVFLECEVYPFPHVRPTGEGTEVLIMVRSGKLLHPVLLRKSLEVLFFREKEEGVEVHVFRGRRAITAIVETHLILAMLMESDEVRIWIMSVEERIHP
jgi:hypothetical protein